MEWVRDDADESVSKLRRELEIVRVERTRRACREPDDATRPTQAHNRLSPERRDPPNGKPIKLGTCSGQSLLSDIIHDDSVIIVAYGQRRRGMRGRALLAAGLGSTWWIGRSRTCSRIRVRTQSIKF